MNYVVIHHFTREDITEEMMNPHVDFLKTLFDRGKLVITGPFSDERKGGMFILDVASEEELMQIVDSDPAILSGYSTSEIRPYKIVFERSV